MRHNFTLVSTVSIPPTIDVLIENHFSIFLIRPIPAAASEWIAENVAEDVEFFVVEPRFLQSILVGLRAGGLVVQ